MGLFSNINSPLHLCVQLINVCYIYTILFEAYFNFRAVPKVGKEFPPGINCSEELSMQVEFHAIVPLDVWEWDRDSEIYMRFGSSDFGDFEHDIGPGEMIRCCFYAVGDSYNQAVWDFCVHMIQ